MRRRDHGLLHDGTTRVNHASTYQHLLGISNDAAYQRTAMMNDAAHHDDKASSRPNRDAKPPFHNVKLNISEN
jgi:hypothetical protein